jgi:hypothetical protein
MNSFPLNIIDIGPLIQKVTHYSGIVLKKCIGAFHDMKYLIKEFALLLFKSIHVFIIVAISLLGITLLFSKNKLGNLLVLCYVFTIIFVIGLIVGVFALIGVCIEKTIKLLKKIIELINVDKKISIKSVIKIIVIILGIVLFAFEFAFILGFLIIMSLIVDFLYGTILNPLFYIINGVYSTTSFGAQTTTDALDSFGTMVRKGFENCG